MYSAKSFQLTKDEFNYLLPVLKTNYANQVIDVTLLQTTLKT